MEVAAVVVVALVRVLLFYDVLWVVGCDSWSNRVNAMSHKPAKSHKTFSPMVSLLMLLRCKSVGRQRLRFHKSFSGVSLAASYIPWSIGHLKGGSKKRPSTKSRAIGAFTRGELLSTRPAECRAGRAALGAPRGVALRARRGVALGVALGARGVKLRGLRAL